MLTVQLIPEPTDEVRKLIRELEAVLSAQYEPHQRHGLALEAIFKPGIRFFVARLSGETAGCAGVALFPDFAEIKRMYVRPALRGLGVAQALLARIEDEAINARITTMRLETGDKQIAAIKAYERYGYTICEAFGDYAQMDAAAIETSVFMEKRLEADVQSATG